MSTKAAPKKSAKVAPVEEVPVEIEVPKKSTKAVAEIEVPKKSTKNVKKELKKDIRAIPVSEIDWSRLEFAEPKKLELPTKNGFYYRVFLNYRYDEESVGPFIVSFGRKFCFGVQPDNLDKDGKIMKDEETGKDKPLKGYKVPIVLTSKGKDGNEESPEEQADVHLFTELRDEVLKYVIANKKTIGKNNKTDAQLDGILKKILYEPLNKEKEIDTNKSPVLYAMLKYFAKTKEVGTPFYGPGDAQVNPLEMTKFFHIIPNIHFDCIFVGGTTISLQNHIYDATVEINDRPPAKRLAPKNTTTKPVVDTEDVQSDGAEDAAAEDGDANEMMQSEEEA